MIMDIPLLSVSWKGHSNELASVCKNLLADNFLVDCTLAAEGQRLAAHRLILSANSPYFRMLFSEGGEKHPIVFLKDISFEMLKAVVDFVYHGETQIPKRNLKVFLALAQSLQITGLIDSSMKNRSENILCSAKSYENNCEVHQTSASHGDSSENTSQQFPIHPSICNPTTAQTPFLTSHEECLDSVDHGVSALKVMPLHESQTPLLLSHEPFANPEVFVKHEPAYSEDMGLKREQVDDIEMKEQAHGKYVKEMGEGTSPVFSEEDLSQFTNMDEKGEMALQATLDGAQGIEHLEVDAAVGGESGTLQVVAPSMQQPADVQNSASDRLVASVRATNHLTVKKHTQIGDGPYVCGECGKAFKQKSDLSVHSRKHTGERPYQCDECGLSFPYNSSLKNHKRRHSGERPYRCDICGICFTQLGNLVYHKRTHTGERPYRCDTCGDCFTRASHLIRHERSHTGERPYGCDLCGVAFTHSSNLARHKRSHAAKW